ncbi:hypothetical protein [Paenibacillus sp. YN15]|uniref:hypothetical protein n=1 Tax=Paenibacillus sp. YN15 TaxID=1742774 RepID=UPI000DCC5B24|nr:hypothetical protein [Paenibacillus sp. YN15]RAV03050.1 hypothetical protein DQG13_08310 [Paenibacillus sp. YN15]
MPKSDAEIKLAVYREILRIRHEVWTQSLAKAEADALNPLSTCTIEWKRGRLEALAEVMDEIERLF